MAIKHWVGGAPARRQVVTITFTGTWASADTAQISVGDQDLIVTAGGATLADIAAEVSASIGATDSVTPTPAVGYSRNVGGRQIPEFVEITASANGAVVTILGPSTGAPISVTTLATTAGSGDMTTTTTIEATGPNHLDNPDNYLDNALPADNDKLIFDIGSVDALYGLLYFRTNAIDLDIEITGDWLGQLGLPAVNAVGNYPEYRARYFRWRGLSKTLRVLPGSGTSSSQRPLWIDCQDQTAQAIEITAGRGSISTTPTIFLAGSDVTTGIVLVNIERGCVSIEPDEAPTGATKYFLPGILNLGTPGGNSNDCIVYIGQNARLAKATDITQNSGTVYCRAITDDGVDDKLVNIEAGTWYAQGDGAHGDFTVGPDATLSVDGSGAGSPEITLNGGTLDARNGSAAWPAVVTAYKGSSLLDRTGRVGTAVAVPGGRLSDITLEWPANKSFSYGNI